jgi:signal transduction histidine kinase
MITEEMDQLFAPFFTTKPDGTGLGLVLSQRTVTLHGGKLWAERGGLETPANLALDSAETATPPPGMTFCVVLPFETATTIDS